MAQQKRRTVSPNPKSVHPRPEPFGQDIPSPSRVILKKSSHKPDLIQSDSFLQVLRSNRDKLCQCFEIYQVLYQNSTPQRCLEHNNFVTLYCENQQKLLCVNCIYGSSSHRLHKVTPIKNAFEQLINDNRVMERKLQQYIQSIKIVERQVQDSKDEGQASITVIIRQLDDQFKKLIDTITDKYNHSRKAILELYDISKIKTDLLAQEIRWLRATYSQKEKSLPRSDEQSSVLYSHLTLNTLLQGQQLDSKSIKRLNFEDMKSQYIGEISRIRQMVETGKIKQRTRLF